jgi:hypothetical protein
MKSVRPSTLVAICGVQLVMIVLWLQHPNSMTLVSKRELVLHADEQHGREQLVPPTGTFMTEKNHGPEQLLRPAEDGQKIPTEEIHGQEIHVSTEVKHKGSENTTEALPAPPPLRVCKKWRPKTQDGGSALKVGGYQCQGEEYDAFGEKLLALANKGKKDSPMWGRQQLPFPRDSTILFFGNSHTRQLQETILCAYKDLVLQWGSPKVFPDAHSTIKMKHNTTLISVHNSWMAHSDQWASLLEKHAIGGPISSVDAIVLGMFNGIPASQNTTFQKGMLEAIHVHPEMNPNRDGPKFDEVAKAFQGVIVSVGMMADKSKHAVKAEQGSVREYQFSGRRNVAILDPRKYVPILGECGTDVMNGFGTCQNGDNGKDKHRCTGAYGGPFDVIAWDLIETLDGLL